MSSTIEQIKSRLSITDVVEAYVKLERAGKNLKGKCPFHNEKTPSFFVSPDRGTYYCFGCQAKGDIFDFVENFEGLDFVGALKVLAMKAGVEIKYENPKEKNELSRLYAALEEAVRYYKGKLAENGKAREYLLKRGLSQATIEEWNLGYAPNDWRSVSVHLNNKGWTDEELLKAGLIKQSETGGKGRSKYYDRFRGRIMFPINDTSGRTIAFSGRILDDDLPPARAGGAQAGGQSAKYLNSPDTPLFSKSHVLYGLDKAKHDIRRLNFSILVEGQMDLLMSHQAGFKNTVASSGTALTEETSKKDGATNNLGLVKRLSPNIIFALDGDSAGIKAAVRGAEIALSLGMDVKIAALPPGSDPADLIKSAPKEWKEALKKSKHVILFSLDKISEAYADPRKRMKEIRAKVLPQIAELQSNMEKSHFITLVRERTGASEDAILGDLNQIVKQKRGAEETVPGEKSGETVSTRAEERLIGVLFWQETLPEKKADADKLRKKIKEVAGEEYFDKLWESAISKKDELLLWTELHFKDYSGDEELLRKLFNNFAEDFYKREFAKKMREISAAEKGKDETKVEKLLKECQELSKKIAEFSKKPK